MGDPKDLEYVKEISQKAYTVVGTLENINATLDLLEAKVPQFFKGIKKMYQKKRMKRFHSLFLLPIIKLTCCFLLSQLKGLPKTFQVLKFPSSARK